MDTYTFILQFAKENWFMAWCTLWLFWIPLYSVFVLLPSLVRNLIIRTYRVIVILLRGWPPANVDADGDAVPKHDIGELQSEERSINGSMIQTVRKYVKMIKIPEPAKPEKPTRAFRDAGGRPY